MASFIALITKIKRPQVWLPTDHLLALKSVASRPIVFYALGALRYSCIALARVKNIYIQQKEK
jgi:hypothetical protein